MCQIRETVTSKNNPLIMNIAKLEKKKYREERGLFIADGEKLFVEAVNFSASIEYVIVREDYFSEKKDFIISSLIRAEYENTVIVPVVQSVFEKISTEKSPQGIISVIKTIDFFQKHIKIYNNEKFFTEPRCTIMLCDLRDPGNMGAVLRSACAFDIDAVYVCDGCVDLFSPKTVRGSMGALFKAPIRLCYDAASQIRDIRKNGARVYAAALDRNASALDKLELTGDTSVCFVIGNEGNGLSQDIIDACDGTVFIPMAENTESLNASVASSVLMWELFKKKRK